ncbi:uncharacterized protein LOC125618085 [Marmota marmota marmota]|uniref:uncharacterized protein LOC125618085 n=1 Tax=Marmota marmota marmota TaxID=9994 RepID=UPI00209399FE|nr:uncharacterized protein LOC125618085 [Marmota marmota marmota]
MSRCRTPGPAPSCPVGAGGRGSQLRVSACARPGRAACGVFRFFSLTLSPREVAFRCWVLGLVSGVLGAAPFSASFLPGRGSRILTGNVPVSGCLRKPASWGQLGRALTVPTPPAPCCGGGGPGPGPSLPGLRCLLCPLLWAPNSRMVAWLRTHAATSPVTSRDLVRRCLRPPRRIFLQEPVRTQGPKTRPPSPMEARSLHGAQEASASGSSWSLVTDGLCRSEPTLRSPGSRSSPRRTKWTVRPTPQSLREELSPDLEQDASGHRRGRPRLLYVTAVWFVGVQAHPHPSSGEPFLIQARSTQGGLQLVPLSARGLDFKVHLENREPIHRRLLGGFL